MTDLRRERRLVAATALVLVAVLAGACGSDDDSETPEPAQPAMEERGSADFGHIHGLGVAEGALYIASHNGLFQAPRGSQEPKQVDPSGRDVMGFSVVSADRFVGSGHPGPLERGPSNLGLIESQDGGKTWENISLLGEVDFHVLRTAGKLVYGFDASEGFMVSSNGGREWDKRNVPAAMFDLAIDPRDPQRLVAATEAGLLASGDGGKRWRPVNQQLAGLLAWPQRNELFLVDGEGRIQRSSDGGRSFTETGNAGGQPAAFIASQGDLYVALPDGSVKRSADGGKSWTVRAAF